jgi:anti-anti-sigma factor
VIPDPPSATQDSGCRLALAGSDAQHSVIWLSGDHDIATKDLLVATIGEAVALGEPAVVLDMSEARIVSAATIGVIIGTKRVLAEQGRPLVLRAPPPCVRRVFEACELSYFLDGVLGADPLAAVEGAAALGSWVDVPATAVATELSPVAAENPGLVSK